MGKSKFFVSRKAGRKAVSVLALLAMLLTLLPAVPAMAAPVAGVSATATDNKAGATATYDVSFTAPSGLGGGDEITVTFATGYNVSGATQSTVKIVYEQKDYTPAYVNVLGTPGTTVKIGVPAELIVGENGAVEVSISGVTNPTEAKSYPIAVRTTNDTAGTTTFTIVANVANKIALDAPSSAVANQVVPLTVTIQDEYGNPTTMDSDLEVTFNLVESGTSNSATLYSDSAATQALTDNKLVIAKGNTSGTAYLKDTEAESVTIAVTNEGGLSNPSDVTITFGASGDLAKIAFTVVPPQNQITAGEAGSFTLQLQDAYGNPVNAGTDGVAVTLTASGANAGTVTWGGAGVAPDPNDNLKATGTISSGTSDLTFTFSDTKSSDKVTITASIAEPALTASAVFKIVPGANDHFVVSVADAYPATGEIEINSDQRAAVTIEARDQYNNPIPQATPLEVTLASTSDTGNGKFYATATSDTAITTATIPADASSVTVYYYDKLRPEDGVQKSVTISASASADTVTGSATVTLMGPRPASFEIAGDDSVEVNLRLPLTIKLLDQYGNPYAVAQDTTVNLTDNKGGEFYTSLVGGTSVPSVTIAAGKSEATVYYRPTSVGTNTVTATANVAVNETTTFSVQGTTSVTVRPAGQVANALSITAGTITAGTTGAVTVKVTDQYGNPVAQSTDLEVTLMAASPTGKFYDQAEGGTEISSVTIAAGESEATVYYYDTKAGDQTINASAPGLDPAEGTITVVAAEPAKIAIEAGELVVNQRAEITFTVVDQFGNPVVVDGSSLTMVLSSSSNTGRFEDESGKQITQVDVAEGQSSATAYYKDSTAGEVTITATTTGLEGSAKLTVQPVPAPDTMPPTVESTEPRDKATGVAVDKVITVTFSEVVKADAAYDGIVLKDAAGNAVAVTKSIDGKVLTIKPNANFTYSTSYTVVIPAGAVADQAGNALAQEYTFSFSTTMPTVTLKAGWNLVSLPLIPNDPSIGTVLASVYDKLGVVWSYDAVAGKWSSYAPGAPSSLTVMRDGKGYWVKVNGDCSFAVEGVEMPVGPQVPPSYELVPGWNLIGFKSTVPKKASEYLAAMAGKYTVIYGYDAATQRFHQVLAGENLQPGKGYWIAVTAPGYIYP